MHNYWITVLQNKLKERVAEAEKLEMVCFILDVALRVATGKRKLVACHNIEYIMQQVGKRMLICLVYIHFNWVCIQHASVHGCFVVRHLLL
jgi:hypothetical protein